MNLTANEYEILRRAIVVLSRLIEQEARSSGELYGELHNILNARNSMRDFLRESNIRKEENY